MWVSASEPVEEVHRAQGPQRLLDDEGAGSASPLRIRLKLRGHQTLRDARITAARTSAAGCSYSRSSGRSTS